MGKQIKLEVVVEVKPKTVAINPAIHNKLKVVCAKKGVRVSDYVGEAIAEKLKREQSK